MLPVMFQNSWMPTVFEDFLNNALRDVLMGMIPFFVGDVIDFFHRANIQNMQMIQGFVDGDEIIIKQVNQRA